MGDTVEHRRLDEAARRTANWKRWGPYLSERQWATVREDYSPDGEVWDSFPHDHARSRAYRWGEDGLLGITDRECRLCFALALWNGRDPILKERLFGLTGPEGNHGEDVKECYYYLDSTPTHSYMKALYKYPQSRFPYEELVRVNNGRSLDEPEFELEDTGVFDGGRYFDLFAEYAKAGPDDILIRISICNRATKSASLHLLPTVWFRNTWSWECDHEGCSMRPRMELFGEDRVTIRHDGVSREPSHDLGNFEFSAQPSSSGVRPAWLFTHNQTNVEQLFGTVNAEPWVKDAFHRRVVDGDQAAVNPKHRGTKAAAWYRLEIPPGGCEVVEMRLAPTGSVGATDPAGGFAETFAARKTEADEFYGTVIATGSAERRAISRQSYAGLLWTKQFYHYIVDDWLSGDPGEMPPPESRAEGRNHTWRHVYARDVFSMPDKWEYPWFAAWDLAFHMVPMAELDPEFAKAQILLFLREWYLHPNGQIPAYEFNFGDVNPPVHAWAAWRVYKITSARGERDRAFLTRVFQKLLLNFTWWVNRKDEDGRNLFTGGFLGLDNIGVFDRSHPLPGGGRLEQADATAWMAFYCATMLAMALELACREDGSVNVAYEDMASKFFEHFIQIVDAINAIGGHGLWDEADGFYYDEIRHEGGGTATLRTRSLVGLLPVIAVEFLDEDRLARLPGFRKRFEWFAKHRADLAAHISYCDRGGAGSGQRMLAIPSRAKLERILAYLLDENEFLAPFGIRSLSKIHQRTPFVFHSGGKRHSVRYVPAESDSRMFGGNSNWRGPVWFPTNYLLVEALERYHRFYGDDFLVELPTGSGNTVTLLEAAREITRRLTSLFETNGSGTRPCHGRSHLYANDDNWKDLVLFYEYFHPESGRGCGASHQTGWTSLVSRMIRKHME